MERSNSSAVRRATDDVTLSVLRSACLTNAEDRAPGLFDVLDFGASVAGQ